MQNNFYNMTVKWQHDSILFIFRKCSNFDCKLELQFMKSITTKWTLATQKKKMLLFWVWPQLFSVWSTKTLKSKLGPSGSCELTSEAHRLLSTVCFLWITSIASGFFNYRLPWRCLASFPAIATSQLYFWDRTSFCSQPCIRAFIITQSLSVLSL